MFAIAAFNFSMLRDEDAAAAWAISLLFEEGLRLAKVRIAAVDAGAASF
jgi:hypothetical protein